MRRMVKYVGPDGEPHIAIQNVDATRPRANQLLAQTAKHNGWSEVEAFPPDMPDHEIRGHINALHVEKGLEAPYGDDELRPPAPQSAEQGVTITDHAEAGKPAPMAPPAQPRTIAQPAAKAPAPSLAHPEAPGVPPAQAVPVTPAPPAPPLA